MQGDDLQLQGDLACENAEIRGQLKVAGQVITPGGGGGGAQLDGDGTLADPLVVSAGPYQPQTSVWVFDDYFVSYPPWIAGNAGYPQLDGVGCTAILQSDKAGGSTQWSCQRGVGPLGPGTGSMWGVLTLQIVAGAVDAWISSTQFLDGAEDGENIPLDRLVGDFDLWYAARVSTESPNDFPASQTLWCGFLEKVDLSVINGFEEGAWFRIDVAGGQRRWFAKYNIGGAVGDTDTGVRVGFTTDHPLDNRAAQDLVVRFTRVGAATSLRFYIDGVLVIGPIDVPDIASAQQISPLSAIRNQANFQSNVLYVDWQCWACLGRPR